ncbi:bile acid:sodium symporter family protein [Streptomyces nigra]|uniref:bile acid:sodium symporter family protein n=1 Tax=Streptomyces nigra TaxID=1827580 RepID=UPI00364994A7
MNTVLTDVFLPAALAVVMLGLGISLTLDDFRRVRRHPRAVAVALTLQLLVLPALCFGLVVLWDLPPLHAVGMMLLAASPGGTVANIFCHLFRGDVALSITLTAVNSVIAVVTVPLVVNFSLGHFDPVLDGGTVSLQFGKLLQVFAIVLVPVAAGMLLRTVRPVLAGRLDRPVRHASTAVLMLVVAGAAYNERANLASYFAEIGTVALLFCLGSLAFGFVVPRAAGVVREQAIASSFEIGAHNATLAMTLAITTLGSTTLAVPAAVYALIMIPATGLFGWLLTRRTALTPAAR